MAAAMTAGEGVDKDADRAEHWLRKAAGQGAHGAMFHLGELYTVGPERLRNEKGAVSWYRIEVQPS